MVRAVGIDIVEVERIRRDIRQFGDRFINRILGPQELAILEQRKDKDLFLAGRFAAKEAVIKALGCCLTERPPYIDLQVVSDQRGMPALTIPSELRQKLDNMKCLLSITHEKKYAAAVAILTEE